MRNHVRSTLQWHLRDVMHVKTNICSFGRVDIMEAGELAKKAYRGHCTKALRMKIARHGASANRGD